MSEYIMYLRKSQMDRDFEDVSVEETLNRHKKILTDFCNSKKISVPIILEEVVSGELLSARPQMQKCLELINTGDYAGIVCMDIDRLSRGSSFDTGYIMQILQINKCKIITPAKIYDLENEQDEQFTDMKFMFSRYELKTITKRMARGRDQSAAEGKFVGSAEPYGYKRYKIQGSKGFSLEVVPEEAQVVRMVFDWYIDGMGYHAIADKLHDMHIPSKYNKDGKWTKTAIKNLITNPVYLGQIRWHYEKRKRVVKDGQIQIRRYRSDECKVFEGLHEAIVDQNIWDRANQVRINRDNTPKHKDRHLANQFAGVMYCHKCGRPITRHIPSQNQASRKPWYACHNTSCDCSILYCEILDPIILEKMRDWLQGYSVNVTKQIKRSDASVALDVVNTQLSELVAQQTKICDMLEKGIYSVELFTKRNSAIEQQIADLQTVKSKLETEQAHEEVCEDIVPKTQYLLDSYDSLDVESKNRLWKEILHRIEYYRKGNDVEVHLYPKIPKLL